MTLTSTTRPAPLAPVTLNGRRRSAPTVAAGQSRGAVVAAVDDSSLALAVVQRAAAVAAVEERPLVIVTVVPSSEADGPRPALDSFARLAQAVTGSAVEPRVVVAEYLARGGQRRQSRRVGATILRVAQAHAAAVIVVGLPDREHQRDRSVSRRVAHGAPAAMRVALVTRTEVAEPYERPLTATPLPAALVAIDVAERRRVARRAQQLQSVELPRLRRALVSDTPLTSKARAQIAARYEAGLAQLRILQHQLDTTPPW
jgi:nucleotide-binding universal stress UspA family protein